MRLSVRMSDRALDRLRIEAERRGMETCCIFQLITNALKAWSDGGDAGFEKFYYEFMDEKN